MTPFEIRLELLKMAKDMLSEEYHSKKNLIEQEWLNKVKLYSIASRKELPPVPTLPNYFTEDDVIKKALILDEFISLGVVRQKPR